MPDTQLNMIKIDRGVKKGTLTFDWLRYFRGQNIHSACEVQPLCIYPVFRASFRSFTLQSASVLKQFIYGRVLNKQCRFA